MKPPDDEIKDSFKAVKMTLNTICSNDLLKKRINEFVLNAKNDFKHYMFKRFTEKKNKRVCFERK